MTYNRKSQPWVPEELPPPRHVELTAEAYAESVLDSLVVGYYPQPSAIDSDSLAEAMSCLDQLGHSDAATGLMNAAHKLDAALRNAIDALKSGAGERDAE